MKACVVMHNMIIEDEGVVDPGERFECVECIAGKNYESDTEKSLSMNRLTL